MNKPAIFEVILGSYEEFVIGYKFSSQDESLTQSFAAHSHTSSVRSVAHSGTYLASGGADDRIVIYDLNLRKEHCMLTHHNGTINCLKFTEGHTHLISGSADGVLAIVRLGNWQLEKIWDKAHKGAAILDIAVHRSNKLALTLGADCTLRTWNLIKGRQAYAINLTTKSKDAKSLSMIKWAEDGVRFLLAGGLFTEIWNIETGGIVKFIEHKNKITSAVWMSDDTLIVGYESGELCKLDINNTDRNIIQAHDNRVKAMDIYEKHLVTCSSNGEVKIWNDKLEEIAKCNTGCRLTCVSIIPPVIVKEEDAPSKKRVHIEESIDIANSSSNSSSKKKKRKNKSQDWKVEAII